MEFNIVEWERKLPDCRWTKPNDLNQMPSTDWEVRSGEDFWKALISIQKTYQPYQDKFPVQLWYRGHKDESFVLLPSIIRNYFQRKISVSIPMYQKQLMERFLAQSSGASEVDTKSVSKRDNEQIEYIADMQHYSVPTNLLDWTEDVGTAFYFASEQEEAPVKTHKNAAIYILNPFFYNQVRNELISCYKRSGSLQDEHNHETAEKSRLPNFSAHFNLTDKCFEDFIIGPHQYKNAAQKDSQRVSSPIDMDGNVFIEKEAPYLPLAILVPRKNPRVRNQGGAFLAFNLCEVPVKWEDNTTPSKLWGYEHIELSKVQEFYFRNSFFKLHLESLLDDNGIKTAMKRRLPFLHKIVVDTLALDDIRAYAKALGKRKDTIYPELMHIGQGIASTVLL